MNSCISQAESDIERDRRLKLEHGRRANKTIERNIKEGNKKKLSCLKLLLLGTGESGKSTIVKQMKIIHIDGFSQAEKEEFISVIKRNIRDGIMAIVVAMNSLHITPKDFNVAEKVNFLQTSFLNDYDYPQEFFDVVSRLWEDEDVQHCYTRSNEYQVIDSAQYFLDKLDEVRKADYVPSLQDILRCRKMTNAITEINFEVKDRKRHKVNFKVLDVGGQQGERKRWIQLFGDVTAILFLADCSSFDQTLREDRQKNRLLDSLEVFSQAWTNRYLQNVPILIFLNKIDLLDRKTKSGHHIGSLLIETRKFGSVGFAHIESIQVNQRLSRDNENDRSEIEQSVAVIKATNRSSGGVFVPQPRRSSVGNFNSRMVPVCVITPDENNSLLPTTLEHEEVDLKAGTNQTTMMWPDSTLLRRIQTADNRKMSCRTMPSNDNSRRPSKDSNCEFIIQVVNNYPYADFEPTNDERKEFVSAFPMSNLEELESGSHCSCDQNGGNRHKSSLSPLPLMIPKALQDSSSNISGRRHKSKQYQTAAIHTDTIRTACYIKNLFSQIIQSHPKSRDSKTGRKRKHLFYYTCAVDTNNIQKVLDGCRSFLMQEHLERFGIM